MAAKYVTRAEHGAYARYTMGGCRCPLCHQAMLRYNKQRLTLIHRGEWKPWADAQPVREHIASLRKAGLSLESIAMLAGVSAWNVHTLLTSTRTRARAAFAAKLLSVQADVDKLEPWAKVDATGTRRRLQALMWMGWSAMQIADRLGMDRAFVRKAMGRQQVRVFAARAVKDLYEELSCRTPPAGERYERASITRTRRYAVSQGWAPPAAWDDIDDPREKPKGVARRVAS